MISLGFVAHFGEELHFPIVFVSLFPVLLLLDFEEGKSSLHFVDIIFGLLEVLESLVALVDGGLFPFGVFGGGVGGVVQFVKLLAHGQLPK